MKGLDVKLDKNWSLIVKQRAGMKCEYCGKTAYLNSHHIFGRRNRSVRWEITNGICLCVGCHKFSSVFSAHETPLLFSRWVTDLRGEEWYDELRVLANTPKKWTNGEKQDLLREFEECLNG
jgi:hypothetical protein